MLLSLSRLVLNRSCLRAVYFYLYLQESGLIFKLFSSANGTWRTHGAYLSSNLFGLGQGINTRAFYLDYINWS